MTYKAILDLSPLFFIVKENGSEFNPSLKYKNILISFILSNSFSISLTDKYPDVEVSSL